MRKTWVAVLLAGLVMAGCESSPFSSRYVRASQVFAGEHTLRKMAERKNVRGETVAQFFLFAGSISQTSETVQTIKFAWLMNDGTYAISSLPMEQFRVKFDPTKKVPTVRFWIQYPNSIMGELQQEIRVNVVYVLITCREEDWPQQVHLPLNNSPTK